MTRNFDNVEEFLEWLEDYEVSVDDDKGDLSDSDNK